MIRRFLFFVLLLALVHPAYRAVAAARMTQAGRGAADAPPNIEHQAVACAQANRFPRLEARFTPENAVASAQVLFQGENRQEWFAVSMRAEGAKFAGILPQPKSSLKEFRYYIEVTDRALRTSRTEEHTTAVVEGSGSCKDGLMASSVGSARVVLKSPVGGAALPAGFAPLGIVIAGAATTAGVLPAQPSAEVEASRRARSRASSAGWVWPRVWPWPQGEEERPVAPTPPPHARPGRSRRAW